MHCAISCLNFFFLVGKLVTSFSIPSNWSKLKSFPAGNDFDKLKSIQGIRVYMTFMVIGVHASLAVGALPSSNPNFFEEVKTNNLFKSKPLCSVF